MSYQDKGLMAWNMGFADEAICDPYDGVYGGRGLTRGQLENRAFDQFMAMGYCPSEISHELMREYRQGMDASARHRARAKCDALAALKPPPE